MPEYIGHILGELKRVDFVMAWKAVSIALASWKLRIEDIAVTEWQFAGT
jgi:hypothetical protein